MKDTKDKPESPRLSTPAVHSEIPVVGFVAAGATSAGAAGAAAGSLAGPVGAAVGGAVAAIAGGIGGSVLGKLFDSSKEDTHWRQAHYQQPYAKDEDSFDDFLAAYRSGYETYFAAPGRTEFDDESARARFISSGGTISWDLARPASLAAWTRARGG